MMKTEISEIPLKPAFDIPMQNAASSARRSSPGVSSTGEG